MVTHRRGIGPRDKSVAIPKRDPRRHYGEEIMNFIPELAPPVREDRGAGPITAGATGCFSNKMREEQKGGSYSLVFEGKKQGES